MEKNTEFTSMSRTIGKEALRNNILAAKIVADIVKTTLGPKGMDKMLVDSTGNVTITNDGVTILEEMEIDHPAAKLIVDIAKTQDQEVGDGTTTVALLTGALLEEAEKLIDRKIHPTLIIKGYRNAEKKAKEILKEQAIESNERENLINIARTSMTGKGAENVKDKLAELIVNALESIKKDAVDLKEINVVKILGGSIEESELVQGVVIDKEVAHIDMPKLVRDASIALIDFPLEIHGPEIDTKITVSSAEQLREIVNAEQSFIEDIAKKIINSGANFVLCQKGIDDVVQYYLAREGIMALRRVPRSVMERVAKASSGKIISNIHDLNSEYLGFARHVEQVNRGEQTMIYVRECKNPRAVSILVYGSTIHALDEIERAVNDGLGVVASVMREGKFVAGGGAIEIEITKGLKDFSKLVVGKEQFAIEAFARALESVPETLAENAGLDPIEIVSELKRRHEDNARFDGLNLLKDRIENCFEAGILEPVQVKTQAISSATELTSALLRIDDILISKEKKQFSESHLSGMD